MLLEELVFEEDVKTDFGKKTDVNIATTAEDKTPRESDTGAITNSGNSVFDAAWYVQEYPDVAGSGIDPYQHYILYGKKNGRFCSAEEKEQKNFDAVWYMKEYPYILTSGLEPYEYYVKYGKKRGHYISLYEKVKHEFDAFWYKQEYDDVNEIEIDAFDHYLQYGKSEGRYISEDDKLKMEFDEQWYLKEYFQGVDECIINPLDHYKKIGKSFGYYISLKEKIKNEFDEKWYKNKYKGDIEKTKLKPVDYFKKFGFKKNHSMSALDDSRKIFKIQLLQQPIIKNKIVFENFSGKGLGCNPKYILYEIQRRKLDFEIVWLVKDLKNVNTQEFPSGIRLVDFDSKNALYEHATAKIWISNYRKYPFLKKGLLKKNGQIYIQTWHGSLGIKKLDADVAAFNVDSNLRWLQKSKYESSIIDYLITNSDFEEDVLPKALWYEGERVRLGHPRNDIFFWNRNAIVQKVRMTYNLPEEKIVLYVPTFRDDGDLSWHNIDYRRVLNTLEKKFGEKITLLVRMHPRVNTTFKLIPNVDYITNVTEYPDIQELLASADFIISDYSSCMFDFLLTRRPGFIYAPDVDNFDQNRGFYYPLSDTPYPVSMTNDELCQNIENFDNIIYKNRVDNFLKEKGCMDDGNASERVVDFIEKIINEQ